jgi:hypothetical protein
MKLNMFRATQCSAVHPLIRYLTTSNNCTSDNHPQYYAKPEAACAVLGSWWWAVCHPKHAEFHLKQGIIKFLYTVASCWVFLCKNCTMMHGSTNVKNNTVVKKKKTFNVYILMLDVSEISTIIGQNVYSSDSTTRCIRLKFKHAFL